jgi:hypothetical protein
MISDLQKLGTFHGLFKKIFDFPTIYFQSLTNQLELHSMWRWRLQSLADCDTSFFIPDVSRRH